MLVPGYPWTTTFVGNWSADTLTIRENQLPRNMTIAQELFQMPPNPRIGSRSSRSWVKHGLAIRAVN